MEYAFDDGLSFSETIAFDHPLPQPGSQEWGAFSALAEALHLAAGVSYYKLFAPNTLVLPHAVSPELMALVRSLYTEGLAEFRYRNRLSISPKLTFRVADPRSLDFGPTVLRLPRRSAVLIGGGKDSLVSVEILRSASEPMVLFAVNPKNAIASTIAASGLSSARATRRLDPKLPDLNAKGALNGHVPVTAIVSLIALIGAFTEGYDTVVVSSERSSNEGNVINNGISINHQHSKSVQFEDCLSLFLRNAVSPSLTYISLLRSLSELHISHLFARCNRYDSTFSSCNKQFKQEGASATRWCGHCPKCRFTFLTLATTVEPSRLIRIFGDNLLADGRQTQAFAELAGLVHHKPWECVGELSESAAALLKLSTMPDWRDAAVVASLRPTLISRYPNWLELWRDALIPELPIRLPNRFKAALDGYLV
ncbi:MAG: hypothetical protein ABL901_10060 [Hyphomicrobiaceae bacterium]